MLSRVRGWLEVVRAVFRRRSMDREMAEEFRFHLESQVEANVAAGMTPAEARSAAERVFGGRDRHAEATRDARGARWLDDLRADVRIALRGMRRAPGTALVTVLTLALGIGATVAIFSIVNGVLLEPLPYPGSDRLVSVWSRYLPESGFDFDRFVLSPPEYADYRVQNTVMEDVAAYSERSATIVGEDGAAVRVSAAAVTSNLFPLLGVRPALGRAFTEAEDDPGAAAVAILSHGLWQFAYGGAADILGRTIRFNGRPTEIVGVMPEAFSFPGDGRQIWAPLRITYPGDRTSHFFVAVGRLRDGVTLERADAEMSALMDRWRRDHPGIHTGHFLYLKPYIEDVVGESRRTLGLLMGAVSVVLLLVCVNVAHVLLARGVARRRELAVCAALGASRRRLAQQTLTESALLALTGTGLGLLFARVAIGPILALAGDAVPRATNVAIDGRVALASAGIAGLVTLLAGLLPALRARLAEPQGALRMGDRASTDGVAGTRVRGALVVAEVALAAVVVCVAALLVRSFDHLLAVDPGFRSEQALVVDLTLPSGQYQDADARIGFHERFRQRMSGLPGVTAAGGATFLPLTGIQSNLDFAIENRPPPAPGEAATSATFLFATPGMADALGIDMLKGRFFDETDTRGAAPVVVVSRMLEERFMPEGALGRRLRIAGEEGPWLTVVGVIDDVLHEGLGIAGRPAYYVPVSQTHEGMGVPTHMAWVLRTRTDPLALAPAVRDIVRDLDPGLPITRMDPLDRVVSESVARPRFTLSMVASFAGLALFLGGLGLYGVLACAVAERVRELGIRMALGARKDTVARMVIGQGLLLTTAGLVIGLAASLASGRVIASLLYDVQPTDPATYAVTAATLFAVTLLACAVPALRALRLDPATILRDG